MSLGTHLYTVTAYATVFEGLIAGESTVFDLHEEAGLGLNTIRKLLMVMKRRHLVHIARWSPGSDGRYTVAVWKLGDKPDAKKPPQKTAAQRSAKRRANLRMLRIQNLGAPYEQRESTTSPV